MNENSPVVSKIEDPAIKRIALHLTPIAVAALVQNIISPATSPAEKRKCAQLILAYGWGHPSTMPTPDLKDPRGIMLDSELQGKINLTFERINGMLAQNQITTATKAIVDPLLELENLLGNDVPN